MEPSWVRPSYLYLLCVLGVVLMAFGALGAVLGVVHLAAPDLQQQGDPFARISTALINVAEATLPSDLGGGDGQAIVDALSKAKAELKTQSRRAGTNELVRGMILLLVGAAVYFYHWAKVERSRTPAWQAAPPGSPAG